MVLVLAVMVFEGVAEDGGRGHCCKGWREDGCGVWDVLGKLGKGECGWELSYIVRGEYVLVIVFD